MTETIELPYGFHRKGLSKFLKDFGEVGRGNIIELKINPEPYYDIYCVLLVLNNLILRRSLGKGDFRIDTGNYNSYDYLFYNLTRTNERTEYRDRQVIYFSTAEEVYSIVEFVGDFVLRHPNNLNQLGFFSLKWALNEVMDNVINHSQSATGGLFLMSYTESDHKLRVAVSDMGIGIFNSLKSGTLDKKPKNEEEALRMSLEKGVTRDKSKGQGNGLFGLFSLITQNGGSLSMASGSRLLNFYNNETKLFKTWVHEIDYPSTIVNFEFVLTSKLDLHQIFPKTYSDDTVDWSIEKLENDEGKISIELTKMFRSGFGTRRSGKEMFNYVFSILKMNKKPVEIDFSDITLVSSSWADEFIGKLFAHLGPLTFGQLVRLKNLNDVIVPIMEHSVIQRLQTGNADESFDV